MRHSRLLLAICLALAPPATALTQVVPAVDVGVVSLGYDGAPRASAVSITPTIRFAGTQSLFAGSATISQFDGGEWSTQAAVAASRFTPAWGFLRGEVSASGSLIAHRTLFRGGDLLARARLHAHDAEAGVWAGGGIGWGRHASSWHPLSLIEGGVWSEYGSLRLGASISSRTVAVADSLPFEGAFRRFERRGTHLDAVATLGWQTGKLELDLLVGSRQGGRLTGDSRWGSISAIYSVTDWLQVIAEAGGEPEVVAQRLPEGRFGLVALRISPWRVPHRSLRSTSARNVVVSRDFIIDEREESAEALRLAVPGARRVEIRADFTDWETIALRRGSDGRWQLPLNLAPGIYRIAIRVDGGTWQAPPGLPTADDGFGSLVGLIVVR